jgi:hypothetical protein
MGLTNGDYAIFSKLFMNVFTTAFEELLCALIKGGGKDVHEEFRKNSVIAVCQTHQLKDLATLISGGLRQPKGKES